MTMIKEGFKETKIGIVPKDWEVDTLNNLCIKMFVGIATSTTEHFADSGIPLIRNQNIKEGKMDSSDMKYITAEFAKANESKTLMRGDILTVRTGYPGVSCVVPEEFEGSQTFTTLISRPKENRINSYYLSYFINSGTGKKILDSLKAGGAQQNLNVKSFETLNVVLPSLSEQQYIVEILCTIDAHIEKLDKIIEDYQRLKKGMMKKLLTKGIGHDEFKDSEIGRIPKDWEVMPLNNIASLITKGTTPSTYGFEFTSEGINFIKVENITPSGKIDINSTPKISKECHLRLSRSIIQDEDILISIAGTIGRSIVIHQEHLPANTNQALAIVRLRDKSKVNPKYVNYTFSSPYFISYISSIKTVGAQPNMNLKQLGDILIGLPRYEEQLKIAEVLLEFDLRIQNYELEREEYIQLKKALMEQLLTGKIRVNNLEI